MLKTLKYGLVALIGGFIYVETIHAAGYVAGVMDTLDKCDTPKFTKTFKNGAKITIQKKTES